MDSIVLSESTVVLAKTYGIYFFVVGLALMSCPERFRKWYEDIVNESRRVLFGGTISLLIGSFIIATHHVIVPDWRIIISLIGYWGVLSGAGCLISNNFITKFNPMVKAPNIVYKLSGLAWLLLGVFLAYKGFLS